jgi:hypothetical protein
VANEAAAIDVRIPAGTERLVTSGNPFHPATYAGASKAGEVVFHGGPENYAKSLQSLYDNPLEARRGYERAGYDVATGNATPQEVFDEVVARLNAGAAEPADALILSALSRDGLRFNEEGVFNGLLNTEFRGAWPNYDEFLDLVQPGRFRATHVAPEFTPADAVTLRGVADTGPFERAAPQAAEGIDPATIKTAAQAPIEAGAHTFVPHDGGPIDQAAREITGASKANPENMILEVHPPDKARMLTLAQHELELAQAELSAASAARAALPELDRSPYMPDPNISRAVAEQGLPDDIRVLLHRYTLSPGMQDPNVFGAVGTEPVTTIGQLIEVVESLDAQMEPLGGVPMSEGDLAKLREGLMAWLDQRLQRTPGLAGTREQRAVQAIEQERMKRGMVNTPEEFHDELVKAWRALEHVVKDDDGAITGWEGTQYEPGFLPKKGADGRPLSPRVLSSHSLLDMLNRVAPDASSEILMGRKQVWPARIDTARLASYMRGWIPDTEAGRRAAAAARWAKRQFEGVNERDLHADTREAYADDLVGPPPQTDDPALIDAYNAQRGQAYGTIAAIHEFMTQPENLSIRGQFRKYRNEFLVGPETFDREVVKRLTNGGVDELPDWANGFMARRKSETPFWDAWRRADNRTRRWFKTQDNGTLRYVESLYDTPRFRKWAGRRRALIQQYHTYRFLLDARWLALEEIEAPTLTFFRNGIHATLDAMGLSMEGGALLRGKQVQPFLMGFDDFSKLREQFAWWASPTYVGGQVRYRWNYITTMVKNSQLNEFPKVMLQMARRDESLARVLRAMGDTPEQWLDKLNDSWELYSAMGKQIDEPTARRLYEPRLKDGTINQSEFDKLIEQARSEEYQYVSIPAFEKEIAESIGNPVLAPMMQRLKFMSEQAWNDATQVIYGQTNRSNVQRLMNHPLLYWPISYQIKATKWLAGLLFDQAFGVDTGSFGALTLDRLHAEHQRRYQEDPEYRQFFKDNDTLLFVASMMFPVTPFDVSVGLSPFTRMAIGAANGILFGTDPEKPQYERNVFAFGPGYTYFELLPRLLYEQRKNAQPGTAQELVTETLGPLAPFKVPVGNRSTSGQASAAQRLYEDRYGTGAVPPTNPFEAPPQRYQP